MTKTKLPMGLRSRLREFARYQHVTRSLQVQRALCARALHRFWHPCSCLQGGSVRLEYSMGWVMRRQHEISRPCPQDRPDLLALMSPSLVADVAARTQVSSSVAVTALSLFAHLTDHRVRFTEGLRGPELVSGLDVRRQNAGAVAGGGAAAARPATSANHRAGVQARHTVLLAGRGAAAQHGHLSARIIAAQPHLPRPICWSPVLMMQTSVVAEACAVCSHACNFSRPPPRRCAIGASCAVTSFAALKKSLMCAPGCVPGRRPARRHLHRGARQRR